MICAEPAAQGEGEASALGRGLGFTLLCAALLTAAGVAAWWGSLGAPLHFDDLLTIKLNGSLRSLPASLAPPPDVPTTGRPLPNLTFAVNYALGGLETKGYHLVNLGLHLLAALTLFGLARGALASPTLKGRYGTHAGPLAFLIALLWLLHPLQTAAVTYLTQRTEVMASLFMLLTLGLFGRGQREGARRDLWRAGAVVAGLCAVASKEISAALPLLVLLFDRAFFAGSFKKAWEGGKVFYPALACGWLLQAALIIGAGSRSETVLVGDVLPPLDYALTQTYAVATYLKLALWPAGLTFDYGMPSVRSLARAAPYALPVLALLGLTLRSLAKNGAAGFCGACFFLVLAPTSSFVPIRDTVFEHRMYLPLAAIVALAVGGGYTSWRRGAPERSLWPVAALALLVAAALGVATVERNEVYASPLALWGDAAAKRPENPRAQVNLGNAWLDRGEYAKAEPHYARALELDPSDSSTLVNLGMARARLGKVALAAEHFEKALEMEPGNLKTRYHYGKALLALGEAERGFAELAAVADSPSAPPEGLALVAEEFSRLGRFDEAWNAFARARDLALAAGDRNMADQLSARLLELNMRLTHPGGRGGGG